MDKRITMAEFVQKSLDLNLFFLRIMKEHALFLEAGFVSANPDLIQTADEFKLAFNELLKEAVQLADGNASSKVLNSSQVVTDRTLQAERKTMDLSGIDIDTALTKKELMLTPGPGDPNIESAVRHLNREAIRLTRSLAEFKTFVLQETLNCTVFTYNFPLLFQHIIEEANFFIEHLEHLQSGDAVNQTKTLMEEKEFWDHIMAEHSLFIAHLLDPTEAKLIQDANNFAEQFHRLERRTAHLKKGKIGSHQLRGLIQDEIKATRKIRDFKSTAEDLILECKVKSLIIPLLSDHILREANHFLNILTSYRQDC